MAEPPEAVSVAERTVFQKVPLPVHFVELESDILAAGARLDQFKAAPMHGDVLLPDVEAGVVLTIAEQGALERRVVAEDHRKRVERKDVAGLDDTIGHRVVGTVRIDAGDRKSTRLNSSH